MVHPYRPRTARVPLRRSTKMRLSALGSGAAVLSIVAVVLFTVILPRAEVVVISQTEAQSVSATVLLDNHIATVRPDPLTLPARIVGVEVSAVGDREARTEKDLGTHARGIVKFINRTGTAYAVVPETSVRGSNNMEYAVTSAVTVPAATVSPEGDVVPGQVLSEVVAREAGERANSISGRLLLADSQPGRVDKQYAEIQSTGISGGTSRIETVVGEEDIQTSIASMREELRRELFVKFRSQLTTDELLPEELLKVKEVVSADPARGQPATRFQLTLTLTSVGLAFKRSDLEALLVENSKKINTDAHVILTGGAYAFEVEHFDPSKGTAKIKVTSPVRIGDELNAESLKAEIAGKGVPDARRALLARKEIKDVRFVVRRSMKNKIPENIEKIDLRVEY